MSSEDLSLASEIEVFMRERSRSSGGDVIGYAATTMWHRSDGNPDWSEGVLTRPYSSPVVYEYIEDIVTSQYEKAIASGAIINNPFRKVTQTSVPLKPVFIDKVATRYSNDQEEGYKWTGSTVPFSYFGGYTVPSCLTVQSIPTAASLRTNVINSAVTQANANIDESEMLSLASMAETGKTVDSMASILGRTIRIAKQVRKLNFKAVMEELSPKELSQRYMELRYAIRPLIYDANGILSALQKKREVVRRTYRGWASDSAYYTDQVLNQGFFYECTVDVDRRIDYEVSARAGVLCDVTIDELTVFGVDKLAESLWELVPFSFIVDWFANVGDTIAALTPDAGVKERASWVTVKETITALNSSGATRNNSTKETATVSVGAFQWGCNEQVIERIVGPSVEPWPQSKLRLDGFKLLDLGIIARQILS